ncbi:MAG TPA: metallophosphoesterase family protein [Arenibaculum sp.]|nr:metallophosphoesterase family protein [Arenibaculum sp.]
MRTIAHISDLHFGRIDPVIVEALLDDLGKRRLDLIVISGDLTQRAKPRQFAAARDFLARLPARHMVVPGNHDIPVFNLFARFTQPFANYHHYIGTDLDPYWEDEEIAVLGLNTVRPVILDFAEGRVNRMQMERVRSVFDRSEPTRFRIVFTHHPFLPPPDAPGTRLVGRAVRALRFLERAGVDLMLAGHLHRAYSGDIMTHHTHVARSILVAQASTATSTRVRNEPNAYNLVTIDPPSLAFEVRSWEGARFTGGLQSRYVKQGTRWHLVQQDPGLRPAPARAYDPKQRV